MLLESYTNKLSKKNKQKTTMTTTTTKKTTNEGKDDKTDPWVEKKIRHCLYHC